jgi:hypothetical protein
MSFALGYFNRFNFDPSRGNYIGKYFDIGISGEWDISISSFTEDKFDHTTISTRTRSLPYTNNLNASLHGRLGMGHIAIYSSYRIGNLFKESYSYPELPRLIIGIELGIY